MSALLPDLAAGLDHIATTLATALPPGTTVLRAGGAFDAGEIRRHVTATPAAIVALLSLGDYTRRGSGGWSVQVQLAAYLLTRDQPALPPRDLAALTLATHTIRAISRANWGRPDAFGVVEQASLDATNLYSGSLDAAAVALWVVTWEQTFILDLTSETPSWPSI
ncbi:hypothetical protein [uncultured Lamprocystis sp.]|jgi:hypothetical protein|uniref:hypothetical protein n=1 Tax=uncultured Lamprocystis sp. TaxID=543132 RepID=UPI0025D1CA18|nr:hypothetical protein [uncultured Lamprocystis sp.]